MKTVFVDSNVFLRYFLADEGGQSDRAAHLFRQAASGKIALIAGPPVMFEVAWTLRAAYRLPREKVLDVLSAIAALKGLRLLDADLVAEAISLARISGADFADAYIVASALGAGADEVASFNRDHFRRLAAKLADL